MSKYRVFIGNPGTGKSTLANCIAERVLFKSGISFGSGKTYKLEELNLFVGHGLTVIRSNFSLSLVTILSQNFN